MRTSMNALRELSRAELTSVAGGYVIYPGQDPGWEWDHVDNYSDRFIDRYSGMGWDGYFEVDDPTTTTHDNVVTAGLGSEILKGVIGNLVYDGMKVYWNWVTKDGQPMNDNNGVRWEDSPFFTQGA